GGGTGGSGFGGSGGFGEAGGFRGGPGFDISAAIHYRTIHGILAALAMVVLFPVGSVAMRLLPGRLALWAHGLFQLAAMCIFIAGVGLGIYLVRMVRIPGTDGNLVSVSFFSLLTNDSTKYHPIVGLVTLATLLPQPILGWLHHRRFKQVQRRQFWSYLHIFNGRIGVTVGIINGGLGLQLAGASADRKRTYIIVAAVMWTLWMLVAIVAEMRRLRSGRRAERATERRMTAGRVAKVGSGDTR
ncbi:hypothetical protein B0T24DRAFT_522608, partial [Lasiosphaeria ovina]